MIEFERDPAKNEENLRKHGVDFYEAATVFADDLSLTIPDPDHSEDEQRFLTMGQSDQQRLLVVSHTERGVRIRIISARRANRREIRDYESDS